VAADSLGGWADPAEAFRAIAALGGAGAAVIACAPRPTGWLELIAAAYDAAGRAFAARPVADMTAAATQAGLTEVRAAGTVVTAAVATATAETAATATDGLWLILCSPDGAEADLANDLAERLGTALLVHPADSGAADDAITVDAASADSWLDLLATMKEADSEPAGIVHLLGTAGAEGSESQRCLTLLALAQGLPDAQLSTPPRLVVVTAGALDAPGGTVVPSQAPLWGLGRVLRNEFPQFNVRLIDLHGPVAALGEPLAAEIAAPDDEDEVILAADRRLGLRLKRVADHAAHSGEAETLHFASGSLDYLSWVPAQRREPAHGEVEIAVKATGLNFRDVMLALGILPDEAVENGFAGATVGMEAAGVVTRVGPGVGNLAVGDSVLFFAPACFSSYVTTRTTAVGRLPAGMGFAEAATIPTTFFTVYYALNELARLRAGERVLIHGAAGGVGLAAIQYCRHVGAEIYATAGTPEKRDIVRLAGVPEDRILDSRTLAFADQIRALTNGEGVDVVVNSLAGEAIHKSLATLRPFGRFLELGKRDFFANSPLGLRPFRNNISYFGIDADQLMAVKPDLAGTLFAEMMQLFEQGAFRPLPYRTFTRDRIVEAFRHMQQSRHIGKIVVAAPEAAAATSAPTSKDGTLRLDPAGSYVVTGGLGGFGLATAQWLAAKGARTLVLASRRGAATEEARDAVAALEKQGVTVLARACDVTDPAQVRALVAEAAAVAPVKGVVHAAAVFDDGIATNMTAEQFERVVAPKLIGGWALHEATAGMALDFFVAYSSVTTILGNPGQANYVAGNMYLEALAQYRRAQGLPALAIGWGAIADAGYLTRNTEVRDSLSKRMGVDALTTDSALAQLERLIVDGGPAVTVVADVNWRTLGAGVPALKSPRFAEVAAGGRSEAAGEALDLNKLLADLSPTEVREVLIELVAEQVGSVLRIPADRLDLDMSVFDMGMDSLMAMELRMAIEERFGVELPAMAISEGASITRLAERIRDHLQGGAKAPQEDSAVHAVLAQHAESVDAAAIRDEMERLSANEEEDTSVS
ncbi:MAG TPA: SDR family NAD(P)-dependent oxidoreductase, partial [Magnetospirillum sp.]|nr:SDR family NAD(P)-dependent oxidoreductase [Magnetospirillum sp.]